MNITEDYVSFETAKLLREKGKVFFDTYEEVLQSAIKYTLEKLI